MSENHNDQQVDPPLSFEEAKMLEESRVQAVKDLLPHLPPPPHQLSPEDSANELEQLRKESMEQLEDIDEEHLFMRGASMLLEQDPVNPQDDLSCQHRQKKIRCMALAIGYARIGDIDKAKQLVNDFVNQSSTLDAVVTSDTTDVYQFIRDDVIRIRREHKNSKVTFDGLSTEEIENYIRSYRQITESDLLAAVAYYSGWIGGISTPERVAEFAKTISDPTQDYTKLNADETRYFLSFQKKYLEFGEEELFNQYKRLRQEGEALQKRIDSEIGDREHYYHNLSEKTLNRQKAYEQQKLAMVILMINIAAEKHRINLANQP